MTPPLTANDITNQLLMQVPRRFSGARVWRQNVGSGIGWDTVMKACELLSRGAIKPAITLLKSRPINFGLRGAADISGIYLSRRVEIEVKAGRDRMTEDQTAFREMILKAGGIHVIARDVEQALMDIEAQVRA